MKTSHKLLLAEMKLLDGIIMWLVANEGASVADIADYIMKLKKQVQDERKI